MSSNGTAFACDLWKVFWITDAACAAARTGLGSSPDIRHTLQQDRAAVRKGAVSAQICDSVRRTLWSVRLGSSAVHVRAHSLAMNRNWARRSFELEGWSPGAAAALRLGGTAALYCRSEIADCHLVSHCKSLAPPGYFERTCFISRILMEILRPPKQVVGLVVPAAASATETSEILNDFASGLKWVICRYVHHLALHRMRSHARRIVMEWTARRCS